MTTTSWNDAEETLLQGLPMAAQLLYLRGLRRHMDYSTGIVGVRRGISLQQLGEVLYVEPDRGLTDSGSPSRDQIRRLLGRLERVGLIVNRSIETVRLIFFLPLADTDQCVQKIPATNPPHTRPSEPATDAAPVKSSADAGLQGIPTPIPATNPPQGEVAIPATPPVTGIRISTDVDTHIAQPQGKSRRAARKTPLPPQFAISPRVRDWASQHGYRRLEDHFAAFSLKAAARGYAYADWDAAFMTAVRDNWAGLTASQSDLFTQEGNHEFRRPNVEPI